MIVIYASFHFSLMIYKPLINSKHAGDQVAACILSFLTKALKAWIILSVLKSVETDPLNPI
jgi:hypothetical protein